jgi:FlaA1/EpsC-like NDP-sugar epimerase
MRNFRNRHLLIADLLLLAALPSLAYAIRFESWSWTLAHSQTASVFTLWSVPLALGVFYRFDLYRRLWQYASTAEAVSLLGATATIAALNFLMGSLLLPWLGVTASRVPFSVIFIHALLLGGALGGLRMLVKTGVIRFSFERRRQDGKRVLIAGAGNAGQLFLRELNSNKKLGLHPVGFVDDDRTKQRHWMSNLQVLGRIADIPQLVAAHHVAAVVIAMPSAPGQVIRQIVKAASDAGVEARTLPSLSEILTGHLTVATTREVRIEDLLRREPIVTDLEQVGRLFGGHTVLVTGAGGSIGSELCRQIAALGPRRLVLLGHGENSIFTILSELEGKYPEIEAVPVIADVRDRARIWSVFSDLRPDAVFHAAAHKHVPLMEANVIEAVTNNIVGSANVADAAAEFGCSRFVLVSTDKAVRPTNIMGATKRVAEHVVQRAARAAGTPFVTVRFGNVLGSRGSVVPTFLRQIKAGGPVTVTHPEMRRYFMTIPEAVQLVLQAAALGRGSELFMLDMGEPVRIVDLARDMIRLCGLQAGEDVEIRFTGARPGEKLYEEMFWSDEVAEPSDHPKILRAKANGHANGAEKLIDRLMAAATGGAGGAELRMLLHEIVPDFAEAEVPQFVESSDRSIVLEGSGNGTAAHPRREPIVRKIPKVVPKTA